MIISETTLINAYKKAKRWKTAHSKEIQKRLGNELLNLKILYDDLISDKYEIWQPTRYIIQDPVMREIICLPFRDRIVQHLVHQALYPLIEKHAINDAYSNIIWRWNLYGVKRISHFLRSCSCNFTKHCRILKLDIQTFFLTINKEILWQKVQSLISRKYLTGNRYDRPWITKIIHQIIFYDYRNYQDFGSPNLDKLFPYHKSMKSTDWTYWLPLGNLTSQLFANIYLHELDHFVKHKLKIKYYGRYVDDFILIHEDKEYLKQCQKIIEKFLKDNLKLTLHPKKRYLQYYKKWVKFLWVMIYPYYRTLWKRTIYRWNQKMKNLQTQTNPHQSWKSYDGFALHHKNWKLRKKRAIQYHEYELSLFPDSKKWKQVPLFE